MLFQGLPGLGGGGGGGCLLIVIHRCVRFNTGIAILMHTYLTLVKGLGV